MIRFGHSVQPLLKEPDQFAWRLEPYLRRCLPILGTYEDSEPATIQGAKRVLVSKIVAKICDLRLRRRLADYRCHCIAFIRAGDAQLHSRFESLEASDRRSPASAIQPSRSCASTAFASGPAMPAPVNSDASRLKLRQRSQIRLDHPCLCL